MRRRSSARLWIGISLCLAGASCTGELEPRTAQPADPCRDLDPVLSATSFVLVTRPEPGEAIRPGARVVGCSRTHESNVVWRLVARDGSVLGEGHASGGGIDGAQRFSFDLPFTVSEPLAAHLELAEPRVSETEGFPPPRTVLPVVVLPDLTGG